MGIKGVAIKNSKLAGMGYSMFPEPGEKQGKNEDSANYIDSTPTVKFTGDDPLTATYDSRPEPGDMALGATRFDNYSPK